MIISVSHLETEALVVGAGIVGLAVAAELGRRTRRVVVIERNDRFGQETSGRSSEVVHAGLYYPPGSWKARLCLEGAALIFDRCRHRDIPLRPWGKLVVAPRPEAEEDLRRLWDNARASGARGLELWSGARLRREEPRLGAAAAIWSPRTAVVDSVELIRSFAVEARERGAILAFRHRLEALEPRRSGWEAAVIDPAGELVRVRTPIVVNAAGLSADEVAALAGIDVDRAGYRQYYCKGDYFGLHGRALRPLSRKRLIYPLPDPHLHNLGVHLTLDVAGGARLGPDATYLGGREVCYAVDGDKLERFWEAGRRILPWLERRDLWPERSGVRPRLYGPGEPTRDFVIRHEIDRGLAGLVNLIGIESPGLTSAPAVARAVVKLLARDGACSAEG